MRATATRSASVRAGSESRSEGMLTPAWGRIVPPRTTSAVDLAVGGAGDAQLDRPVGEKDTVAGGEVLGERGVGDR